MPQMMPIYWMMTWCYSLLLILMMLDIFFYKNENIEIMINNMAIKETLYKW